jgi:hypothetical protein
MLRAVEVEVVFFFVFAVVGLAVRQPEHAFFEDGVPAISQSQAKAQQLVLIAHAGKTVLAPMVGTRSRLVMSKVVPCIAILTVVLANCPPLALAKVGSSLSPRLLARAYLLESDGFEGTCLL